MGQRLVAVGTLVVMNAVFFVFLGLFALVTLAASVPFALALFRL